MNSSIFILNTVAPIFLIVVIGWFLRKVGIIQESFMPGGLDVQATLEAFYRLDVSDNLAVTADAQWLVNPGFNSDDPLVLGLRARFNM